MKKNLTVSAYAKIKGCDEKAVRYAIKTGKIEKGVTFTEKGHPRIIQEIADQEWASTVNSQSKLQSNIDFESGVEVNTASDEMSLGEINKKKAFVDLQIAQIKRDEAVGILVNKSDIYDELYKFGLEVRTSILSVPDRTIDNIMASKSRSEGHKILLNELTKALEMLSNKDSKKK